MAPGKNPKRLQCVKKKSRELSILCGIGFLFICRDTSSNSFESWPEDSESWLSLIDKYNNTITLKNGRSGSRRGETQENFLGLANKNGKKIDTPMVDFRNLGYDELIQMLSRIDQAQMGVDQRLQELDSVSWLDYVGQRHPICTPRI